MTHEAFYDVLLLFLTLSRNIIPQQINFKSKPSFLLSTNILLIFCREISFLLNHMVSLFYVYSSFYFESNKQPFFTPLP